MASKQFNMWLPADAAKRVQAIVTPYHGSVGGYAAELVIHMSRLPHADQVEVRELVASKIRRLDEEARPAAPTIPATPTTIPRPRVRRPRGA